MATKGKIVLTGATGFLGSHLMDALLEQGERLIVLGRPCGKQSLFERIEKTLAWFGRQYHPEQLQTTEVDFLKPRLGLPESSYRAICADAEQIIHCASDTSFAEANRSNSHEANVRSLAEILDLAKAAKVSGVHYISTAYSAGITDSPCQERLSSATMFHNVYEETKSIAEREIATVCSRQGTPWTIIRPAVVYGHSRTGRANRFNALYYHVRSLACIRDIYLNDIRCHGGKKSASHGIHLDDQGVLHLPLRLVLERAGHINLIPIDYFVAATLAIAASGGMSQIYHLTSPTPVHVGELAKYCQRFLALDGIEVATGQGDGRSPNPAEEMFDRFIEPYRPYLSDTRTFERLNTDRASGWLQPPIFSYNIFKACMEYAFHVDWGRRLLDDRPGVKAPGPVTTSSAFDGGRS